MSTRAFAVIAILALPVAVSSWQGPPQLPPQAANEILVQFRPQAPADRRNAILASQGAQSLRRFDNLDVRLARLPAGRRIQDALAALRADADVVAAQPNFVRAADSAVPNDPYWTQNSLWGLDKIRADDVWASITTGSDQVVIAGIDTGVNYNHPDLAANMWHNPGEIPSNNIDDDNNGYIDDVYGIDTINGDSNPMDDNGHGTHTAGTFAGVGNNGVGVTGVNWNAKIIACKFLSGSGSGVDSGAVACLDYLIALKNRGVNIRVTNNSWGGFRDIFPATVLMNAFDRAGAAGILNVCSAGNDNTNIDASPYDPASFSSASIVSVAASTSTDARASFSSYGANSVDLAAPGVSILSTSGNGYGQLSGTSMAAPHVTGVAALLSSIDPSLSTDSLKMILLQQVEVLPQWAGVVASGGRLDAFRAASFITPPSGGSVNVALAANGGTAFASTTYSGGYAPAGAINGDRKGSNWGSGGGWNDATPSGWPDWLEVRFAATESVDKVSVFSVQDNYAGPSEPTAAMAFSQYGVRDFTIQYWTGSAWTDVPGGSVNGNSLVWRTVQFTAVTTSRIRVNVTNALNVWSRMTELEVYRAGSGPPPPPPPSGDRFNFALASNGATATGSSTHSSGYAAAGAINGDRKGANWGAGGGWNDATPESWPDSFEVVFAATQTIDEVNVFSVQDNYASPAEPIAGMTFSNYGLRNFEVQYWTGSAWQAIPGASVTANTQVWRQFMFTPIATSKIRVWITSALQTWSRITEVEAWGGGTPPPPPPPPSGGTNVALASNGASAAASSFYSSGYSPAGAINGDRQGTNWGAGGGWNDATPDSWPDSLEITFAGSRTITQINVFSVQDNYASPSDPTLSMTFTQYGVRDFQVQYWTGTTWATIPGGSVTGNTNVWRQFTFSPITTSKIRIVVSAGLSTWSRITEVEAFTSGG